MEKAAALKYIKNLPAPFLLAKGKGRLAEKIISLANSSGVAVVPMPGLLDKLYVLEPGSFIPEDYFQIVAELLAFVHTVNAEKGNKSS